MSFKQFEVQLGKGWGSTSWRSVVFLLDEEQEKHFSAMAETHGLTLPELLNLEINGSSFIPKGEFWMRDEKLDVTFNDPEVKACLEAIAKHLGKTVNRLAHEAVSGFLNTQFKQYGRSDLLRHPKKGRPPVFTGKLREFAKFLPKEAV